MTHTFVILEVSRATFDEIARRLQAQHYSHTFTCDAAGDPWRIDMHGIALEVDTEGDQHATQAGDDGDAGVGVLRDGAAGGGQAGAAAGDGADPGAGAEKASAGGQREDPAAGRVGESHAASDADKTYDR